MVELNQEQFHIPFPLSLVAALHVARGSIAWAPVKNDPRVVRRHFTRFYRMARRWSGMTFEPGRAAELEVGYWIEHRRLAGNPDKSSFVEAGVIPRLREAGEWTVFRCRPGASPFGRLAESLGGGTELAASLRASPALLGVHLGRSAPRALLVVDQMEEAFNLAPADEALQFCASLASASVHHSWRALLTVRDDYLPRLAESAHLRRHLGALVVLGPVARGDVEAAIRGPLARVGFSTDAPDLPGPLGAA